MRRGFLVHAVLSALVACGISVGVRMLITPTVQALYANKPDVTYAPAHFQDARQYVLICIQGYNVPDTLLDVGTSANGEYRFAALPTLAPSRISWMPFYPFLHCALNRLAGLSLVYTGIFVTTLAAGVAVFFAALTLRALGVARPALVSLTVIAPLFGATWLFLPGADALFLAMSMLGLWLVLRPPAAGSRITRGEALRTLTALPLGGLILLTKPNALPLVPALAFAFLYQSWRRSALAGYTAPFNAFIADVVIDQTRPLLRLLRVTDERRPLRYDWPPLLLAAGIGFGMAFWLAYTSTFSGVPFYFLDQQLNYWGRAWAAGNLSEMLRYYAQMFDFANVGQPWQWQPAWNLAASVSALVPAASRRVPLVLRGMLLCLVVFIQFAGLAHNANERYLGSTALVGLAWAAWIAPVAGCPRPYVLRYAVVVGFAACMVALVVGYMFPNGLPKFIGIVDGAGVSPW